MNLKKLKSKQISFENRGVALYLWIYKIIHYSKNYFNAFSLNNYSSSKRNTSFDSCTNNKVGTDLIGIHSFILAGLFGSFHLEILINHTFLYYQPNTNIQYNHFKLILE